MPSQSDTPTKQPHRPSEHPPSIPGFVWTQLTRSPPLIASWTLCVVCSLLWASSLAALEPIRPHLLAVSILAGAGAIALLPVKYLFLRRDRVLARLASRPLLADLAASVGGALAPRGLMVKALVALLGLLLLSWTGAYALVLAGRGPQLMLDVIFWAGGGVFILMLAGALGLRATLRFSRRVLARNFASQAEDLLAGVKQEIQDQIDKLVDERAALALGFDALDSNISQILESTTAVDNGVRALNEQIEKRHASTNNRIDNISRALSPTADDEEAGRNLRTLRDTVGAVESSGFHVVQRHIPRDDLEVLARRLSDAFDLNLTAPTLGYVAHRVRELEARSLGRIAAPMSDVLVRIAALHAVTRKEASIIEIGTLFGIGATAMHAVSAARFDRLKLTFVDPLSGYYGGRYGPALSDLWTGVPVTRETLEHNIRVAGVPEEDVHIIQFSSEEPEAIEAASGERYDLLIVDGDHSYDGVMRDFNDYAPLMRKDALIVFDDYGVPEWSGVTEAVDEILAEHKADLRRVILDGKTMVCRMQRTFSGPTSTRGAPAAVKSAAK